MNRLTKKQSFLYISLAISIGLIAYVIYRALNLSFVHDESHTYLYHSIGSIKEILLSEGPAPTNNHIFNTLLVKLSHELLGTSEFALRLANVIAFLIYLLFSYKLSDQFRSKSVKICSFILLLLNPFLLDYFSLARGYGLSLSFLLVSIYFLMKYFVSEVKNMKNVILIILPAVLASFSNLTLFNYFLIVIGLLSIDWFFYFIKSIKNEQLKQLLTLRNLLKGVFISILIVIPVLYFLSIGLKLREANQLYFGGKIGFWSDTIRSLIESTTYFADYPSLVLDFVEVLILLFFISGTTLFIYLMYKRKYSKQNRYFLIYTLILTLLIVSNILQFYLFDNLYLLERTALIYIPIIMLFISSQFDVMQRRNKLLLVPYLFLTLLYGVNFLMVANLDHTYTWRYDSQTKELMKYVDSDRPEKQRKSLGVYWLFYPTSTFYLVERNYDWIDLHILSDEVIDCELDYYYVPKEKIQTCYEEGSTQLQNYGTLGGVLFKVNEVEGDGF